MSKQLNRKLYIAVGIGGMIGAVSRYGISSAFSYFENFPIGTLAANLLGCFILSFLLQHQSIKEKLSPEFLTGLTTGVIGAFTTYSTFALETIQLWQQNAVLSILYVGLSMFGGLLSCYVGFKLANKRQDMK
ncbi:fluoride efflux transporter CrcB [Oceanobacillus caeni]|uniref:fluoride efflux transporter CrcB n=1 Tax=Bacillaceae TaxID=186817 RepID=UPI000AE2B1DD|nr:MULTISPECIES: fluoride efflux transporter CrcB [Bacillaceae]MCR1833461.1 fluoride efflux transporter CrcB [Oceanobacillus caeni]